MSDQKKLSVTQERILSCIEDPGRTVLILHRPGTNVADRILKLFRISADSLVDMDPTITFAEGIAVLTSTVRFACAAEPVLKALGGDSDE